MAKTEESQISDDASKTPPGKKDRPTRTRKEAEAARQRPIVGGDRKQARKVDRQKRDEAMARQQEALRTGDERYLPPRDKGKIRRYVRNWIDARWSLSEFLLPAMVLFLVAMFSISLFPVSGTLLARLTYGMVIFFYSLLGVSVAEGAVVWMRLKRRIHEAFPGEPIPKGTWFYCYSRMIMFRRWRSPRPQVARGDFPKSK